MKLSLSLRVSLYKDQLPLISEFQLVLSLECKRRRGSDGQSPERAVLVRRLGLPGAAGGSSPAAAGCCRAAGDQPCGAVETRAGTETGRWSRVEKIFTMQGLLLKDHCFKETGNVFVPCKELEFQDFIKILTFV